MEWVTQQISPQTPIACDQQTCAALRSKQFGRLQQLSSTTTQLPLTSRVLVETSAIGSRLGTIFNTDDASVVLASFGTGSAQVTVRVIAPHNGYRQELNAGLSTRKGDDGVLLGQSRIQMTAQAKQQLMSGNVDTRLAIAVSALAGNEPVDIIDFGNYAPGASPGLPLRYVDIAKNGKLAHLSDSAYEQALTAALVHALPASEQPLSVQIVPLPHSQSALRILYGAPS